MDKRKIRDISRLVWAICFFWLYIPHVVVYSFGNKSVINSDLYRYKATLNISIPWVWLLLLYNLHNNRYYRSLFYFRIGPIWEILIGWWRPGDRYFAISKTTKIGPGAYFAHPFSTEINANSIGKNFSCRHQTTLGNKQDGDNASRPTLGDDVTLGVNVTIIGNVRIGNNVTIGAGSVVVKDVPDNAIVAGNPAKIIKFKES